MYKQSKTVKRKKAILVFRPMTPLRIAILRTKCKTTIRCAACLKCMVPYAMPYALQNNG